MASNTVPHTRLVGTNIAAKKLRIPEREVRRRALRGELPAERIGKLWKFPLERLPKIAAGAA